MKPDSVISSSSFSMKTLTCRSIRMNKYSFLTSAVPTFFSSSVLIEVIILCKSFSREAAVL